MPKKIGRYIIREQVAKGSMGSVYSAEDPFRDMLVAIKLAHPQFTGDDEEGERFKKLFFNEAHAAGALNHPNIIKIYEGDIDDEKCYLVMELLENAKTQVSERRLVIA
ncbi:MAG: protein kinase [Cycloclasticus sp.]